MTDVVDQLDDFVGETRGVVDRIAETTARLLAAAATPTRADLGEIEPLVVSALGDHEAMLHGAGFVAAPGLLEDAPWWLEWFAWDAGTRQRLVTDNDPRGAHFFDYTLMPWFTGPRDGGGRVVTGPYVDYLCTDDYTLTFTSPVRRPDGTFAGVAGVDVRVGAVEQRFLAMLRASPRTLVLVNDLGRVVISNSAHMLSGDLVPEVDVPSLAEAADPRLTRIGGSELALLDLGPR
jgi:hypothetical protein